MTTFACEAVSVPGGGLPVACLATQTVTTDTTVVSSSTFAPLAVAVTDAFFTHCTAQPVPAVICGPPSSARAVPAAVASAAAIAKVVRILVRVIVLLLLVLWWIVLGGEPGRGRFLTRYGRGFVRSPRLLEAERQPLVRRRQHELLRGRRAVEAQLGARAGVVRRQFVAALLQRPP